MSKRRDNMRVLRRRRDFLIERLSEYPNDEFASYDKAELAALNWAINALANLPADQLKEVERLASHNPS